MVLGNICILFPVPMYIKTKPRYKQIPRQRLLLSLCAVVYVDSKLCLCDTAIRSLQMCYKVCGVQRGMQAIAKQGICRFLIWLICRRHISNYQAKLAEVRLIQACVHLHPFLHSLNIIYDCMSTWKFITKSSNLSFIHKIQRHQKIDH